MEFWKYIEIQDDPDFISIHWAFDKNTRGACEISAIALRDKFENGAGRYRNCFNVMVF